MFSITEQFSAVTKSQLEAQFSIFNSLAGKAVESAQKVFALNLNATKASVEKSSDTARRLLEAKDPQEFFSVGSQAPNFEQVLAYSRQLFGIASTVQAELLASARERIQDAVPAAKAIAATVTAPAVAQVSPQLAQPVQAPAPQAPHPAAPANAPTVAAASTSAANDLVEAPQAAPKAAAKAIAKAKPATATTAVADAVTQLSDKAVAEKPAAAPIVVQAPAATPAPQVVAAVAKAVAAKPAIAAKPAATPKAAAKPSAVSFPSTKSVALKSVAAPAKPAAKAQQGKQLDMLGGGKGKK